MDKSLANSSVLSTSITKSSSLLTLVGSTLDAAVVAHRLPSAAVSMYHVGSVTMYSVHCIFYGA